MDIIVGVLPPPLPPQFLHCNKLCGLHCTGKKGPVTVGGDALMVGIRENYAKSRWFLVEPLVTTVPQAII